MTAIRAARKVFEANARIYESVLLTFKSVDGWDVYNCSLPFTWKGQMHMFGRVEKRTEWANSHVRLFVQTGKDEYTAVPDVFYPLEDPFIAKIDGEMVMGGTHVRKMRGDIESYSGYFYRGPPERMLYFTTGPYNMKDIRLVQLSDGRLGVFSRPRTANVSSVGFIVLNGLHELADETVGRAEEIRGLMEPHTWGGVNQAYLLSSGKIGCIAHYSYEDPKPSGEVLTVYLNYAFVFDPVTRKVHGKKVIGTKACFPAAAEPKVPALEDCVFTTGIVMRGDGKCDLYSGVGDTAQGRLTIDYPFEGYGKVDPRGLCFDPCAESSL